MSAAEQRGKDSAMAAYLKANGVTRKTGKCPWGCGGLYAVDRPDSLFAHLNICQGGKRQDKRQRQAFAQVDAA